MARPHKQMPGKTYHINFHVDRSATVDCTYLCPYCNQNTTASFEANANTTEILEKGGFFESLRCDLCGKITDVRYYHDSKV